MLNELLQHPLILYAFLALFSLSIGSLLNVIIHRLPLMLEAEWQEECKHYLNAKKNPTPNDEPNSKQFNLFFPRSHCPSCEYMIPIWHNIPVLSFLILKGQCHQCHTKISWRYPLVELFTMLLSILAAVHFGFTITLLFALLFIWIVICIAFIDLNHQIIPDGLNYSLLWLGLVANTQTLFIELDTAVLSAVAAYLLLWFFIKLFYLITGKIGMGHGDFKLFAAFGAWFGGTQLPLILLTASFTGAIIGMVYLKRAGHSKETPIPFGPFLCLAGLISLFYGDNIINWYLGFY